MASDGFEGLGLIERAQALNNLGNILNHIGRFVEAIEAWDRALALVPNMAMANGNRGIGLSHDAAGLHGRPIEVITEMSKSRRLGFTTYQPMDDALFDLFARLRHDRLIP